MGIFGWRRGPETRQDLRPRVEDPSTHYEEIEVLPPLERVVINRNGKEEIVEIDHVGIFEEEFPHTEIIRPEDEKPMESRIPKYPYYPERGHVLPEVAAHSPV